MESIQPLGDQGLLITFGNRIDPEIHKKVRRLYEAIKKEQFSWLMDVVPAYTTIMINYNPLQVSYEEVRETIKGLKTHPRGKDLKHRKRKVIPTLYGGETGPDLEELAKLKDLSIDEVIEIHSRPEYLVYMLGFTPGFPYLGGMDERIAAPRLKNPRKKIPKGSVGIAGSQTGIYPMESPGGWRLIGRTPIPLFDPEREDPFYIKPGDILVFKPIDEKTFNQLEKESRWHHEGD